MLIAGFAQQVITPSERVWLAGYAARTKMSEGVHDDLYIKAFYIKDNDTELVMLALDVTGVDRELVARIRERVLADVGVKNVSVSATHTHSGPSTGEANAQGRALNGSWLDTVVAAAADVGKRARGAAEPVRLYTGACIADEMTKNRRAGETATDPELAVLRVENAQGGTSGLLVNYACHCTILDANNYRISADYPGYLSEALSKTYPGAVVLFVNGACGDLNIGYSADASALGLDMGNLRTFQTARHYALYLAGKVQEALRDKREIPQRLYYQSFRLDLPIKEGLPTIAQLEQSLEAQDKRLAACADADKKPGYVISRVRDRALLRNIRLHAPKGERTVAAESVVIGLGDMLIMTIPGELFCEIGMALKAVFADRALPVIAGYSNGSCGYIPTREAHLAGGYECETSVHSPDSAAYLVERAQAIRAELPWGEGSSAPR